MKNSIFNIKCALFLLLSIGILSQTKAQVGINADNSNPDSSAMLDIKSTDKGLLVPRMTTAQRTAINGGNPATSLLVYDTELSSYYFWDGSAWKHLEADNLGNHVAAQNINLNGKYLSGSGNDDGIFVDSIGNVRLGQSSSALHKLHVNGSTYIRDSLMGQTVGSAVLDANFSGATSTVLAVFNGGAWQSFTCEQSGYLTKVDAHFIHGFGSGILRIYLGDGISSTLLSEQSIGGVGTGWQGFNLTNQIPVEVGQKYTIFIQALSGDGRWSVKFNGSYPGGSCGSIQFGHLPNVDARFKTYVRPFFGEYKMMYLDSITMWLADASISMEAGKVTATSFVGDGSALTNLPNQMDNLGNHVAAQNINLNGKYLSGSGNDDGIFVDSIGNVGIGTNTPDSKLTIANNEADGSGSPSGGISFHRTNVGGYGHAAIYTDGSTGYNGSLVFATDGDGVKNYNPTEKMRLTQDGHVGIGEASPTSQFIVRNDSNNGTANEIVLKNRNQLTNGTASRLVFQGYRNTNEDHEVASIEARHVQGDLGNVVHGGVLIFKTNTGDYPYDEQGVERMRINENGHVGIGLINPSQPLQLASGAFVTFSGVWTNASDISRKYDIKDLSYGLKEVMQMHPTSYSYKTDSTASIGFIAQEMEQLIPEVVSGEEGEKGIAYGLLTAVLVNAIQEQQKELEAIRKENSMLKSQSKSFEQRLTQLESRLMRDHSTLDKIETSTSKE